MSKKREVVEIEIPITQEYGDEGVVTKDRDLTPEEIQEIYASQKGTSSEPNEYPSRKGIVKVECACGRIANVSEEIIEDGLSWSMIIGNDHFLTLHCDECGSKLTLFIDEIKPEDELPKESNEK
jgi:hypothetical protein